MTQHERIMEYIVKFGSITPMDAFFDLGITKLSTRIGEMRELGANIVGKRERAKNRFGDNTEYMRYTLG